MARERRSKKEILIAKIDALDEKITGYANKIAELTDEKEALQKELEAVTEAEKKAEEEAQLKEVLKLIKSKNVSIDELKALVENR